MNRVSQRFGKYIGTPLEIREKYMKGLEIFWKDYYKMLVRHLKFYPEFISYVGSLVDNSRYYRGFDGISTKDIRREDLVKILDIKKSNTDELQNYAEDNNFNKIKEILEQTDEILIDSSVAYYTDNVEIVKYLLENEVKIKSDEDSILRNIENSNYEIIELLLINNKLDTITILCYTIDVKMTKLAFKYAKEISELKEEMVEMIHKELYKLSFDQLKRTYLIYLE